MTATVAPPEPAAGTKRSPFVGLEPYSEDDAAFFFGREREKRIIASNLRATRLTLFYGSSGVGKSSVLQAGVVHDLRARVAQGGLSSAHGGRAPFAITYFNAWRDAQPLARLMERIRVSAMDALGGEPLEPWDGVTSPVETLERWTRRVRKLLIVLDQFEEYFLYHPDETGPGTFHDEFPRIVNDRSVHVNFMLSIREDAWAKLDRFKGAIPDLFSNYLRLGHLDRDAARRAIEGPIEEYNRRYADEEGEVGIEPALIESVLTGVESGTLLGDARASGGAEGKAPAVGGAGPHSVETPYLQLVVDRLWEVTGAAGGRMLTDAKLKELGGPAEIVRGHLERAMGELTPDEQAVAADSFRFLVTSSKTKVAQRVSDLAEWTGHPEGAVERVLERLSSGRRGRILRPLPPPPGEESDRFELFHDVLADPVLAWRRRFQKDREAEALARQLEQEDRERLEHERASHRRQVRRIKVAGAIVVALLAAGLGIALVFIYQQKEGRSKTLAGAAIGQIDKDPELSLLLAREAWNEKHTARADEALRRALGASLIRRRIVTGGPVYGALPGASGKAVVTLTRDGASRWSLVDGRRIGAPVRLSGGPATTDASDDGSTAIVANERGVVIWPTASRAGPIRSRRGAQIATAAADGRYAAAQDGDELRIWDTRRPQQPPAVLRQTGFDDAWLAPRGTRLVGFNCVAGTAQVVDWQTGDRVRLRVPGAQTARRDSDHKMSGCLGALSPDGGLVATAVSSPVARIWDARTGALRGEVRGDKKGITSLAWRPDSSKLALTGGKEVRIVGVGESPRLTRVLAPAHDWVFSARWSADGRRLVAASNDGTASVYDMEVGNKLVELRGHASGVNSAEFVGSTYDVVTGGSDGTVRLWHTATGRELSGLGDWALDSAYSPKDGRVAIAATRGRGRGTQVVMIWDPATGKSTGLNIPYLPEARTVAFDRSGGRLVVGGVDDFDQGIVTIVDLAAGQSTPAPGSFSWGVNAARFSPDGRRIAVAMDYGFSVVDLSKGAAGQQDAKGLEQTQIGDTEFSPRGDLVLVGDADGFLRIYDPRHLGRAKRVVKAHEGFLENIAFSPDGKRVLTAGEDQTARLWDARDWHLIRVLQSGEGSVAAAEYSPDGRMIATAGSDRSIRVWNADSGSLVGIETPHADFINSLQFSPDGRSLLSGSDDGTVKITPCPTCVPTDELSKLAAARSTRRLTPEERRTHLGD